MQLRVKPSAWITTSGLSPAWTLSTARNRISSSVLWSRARASRRFMPHYTLCLLTYGLVNIRPPVGESVESLSVGSQSTVSFRYCQEGLSTGYLLALCGRAALEGPPANDREN